VIVSIATPAAKGLAPIAAGRPSMRKPLTLRSTTTTPASTFSSSTPAPFGPGAAEAMASLPRLPRPFCTLAIGLGDLQNQKLRRLRAWAPAASGCHRGFVPFSHPRGPAVSASPALEISAAKRVHPYGPRIGPEVTRACSVTWPALAPGAASFLLDDADRGKPSWRNYRPAAAA
jgi:hypothetical protein